MEEKEIDWSKMTDVLEAAKPFSKSYKPHLPVMLVGIELYFFLRHHFVDRQNAGRRKSDVQAADRIKALEAELAAAQSDYMLLQQENTILLNRLKKDRRQRDVLVDCERRHISVTI